MIKLPQQEEWISTFLIKKYDSTPTENKKNVAKEILCMSPLDYICSLDWGGEIVGEVSQPGIRQKTLEEELLEDVLLTWGMLEDFRTRYYIAQSSYPITLPNLYNIKQIPEAIRKATSNLKEEYKLAWEYRVVERIYNFPNSSIYNTLTNQRGKQPRNIDQLIVDTLKDLYRLSELIFPSQNEVVAKLRGRDVPQDSITKYLLVRQSIYQETGRISRQRKSNSIIDFDI